MFFYRVTKITRAVPKVISNDLHSVSTRDDMGTHVRSLIAGGEYGKISVEEINQASYIREIRPGE